jgi:hypothetical protein
MGHDPGPLGRIGFLPQHIYIYKCRVSTKEVVVVIRINTRRYGMSAKKELS